MNSAVTKDAKLEVRELVSDLVDAVGQMDHRLQCKLILTGESTYDIDISRIFGRGIKYLTKFS